MAGGTKVSTTQTGPWGGYVGAEGTGYDEAGVEINPAGQVQWGGVGHSLGPLPQFDFTSALGNVISSSIPYTAAAAVNKALMLEEAKSLSPDWSGADTDVDISDSEVDIAQGVI